MPQWAAAQVRLMTGKPAPDRAAARPLARPSWPVASPRATGVPEAARASAVPGLVQR